MGLIERTLATFGPECLGDALFHLCAPALRFELNSGGGRLEMFTQSWDRARALLAEVFPAGSDGQSDGASDRHVVLRSFPASSSRIGQDSSLVEQLAGLGVEVPADAEREEIERADEDGAEPVREVRMAFPIAFDGPAARGLLWAALAGELGVRPAADVLVYFVDLRRELLLHPYDDRGADLVSPRAEALRPIELAVRDWVLDSKGLD